jgi:aminopeptidase N
LRAKIGTELHEPLQRLYDAESRSASADIDSVTAARRALRNMALGYLVAGDPKNNSLAYAHYTSAKTMTDRMVALQLLADSSGPEREKALADFYDCFKDDPLVVEKWLRVQALSRRKETLAEVKALTSHPAFEIKNPNRFRALVGAYSAGNLYRFYTDGAAGFEFLGDMVLKLDPLNPTVAARAITALESWRRLPPDLQQAAKAVLTRVKETKGISRHTFEIASKCLGE